MLAHAAYGCGPETTGHALRLILSGLFGRHPTVQIVFGHAAEALPLVVYRIDTRLEIGVPGLMDYLT